ncbi:MAG: Na/Pi cotransporter family protein [Candidatus Enterenecus sp.]
MSILDILTMLGGLALFLFGMSIMSESLERAAGSRLRAILERLTSSTIKGFFLGLVVTAVIQSSSATTVMVVGFVSSGLMTLNQAVGIIMGANVGTTVTSWLLSLTGVQGDSLIATLLKPSSFSPVLAVIGVVLYLFCKGGRKKDIGAILLGFATLMFGMETMSGAVGGLADIPEFRNLLLKFSNPVLGVLAGALLTAVLQSSSASVGILQALSSTGALAAGSAVPIILGQNIGTTVTALISSAGASKDARRAALIHLYFNLIGSFSFLALFYLLRAFVDMPFLEQPITQVGIALIHTAFNLLSTAVMLPFGNGLVKLACLTIRDEAVPSEPVLLDERLLVTPSIALEQCSKLVCGMASLSETAAGRALGLIRAYNGSDVQVVDDIEAQLDQYEDMIGTYLVKLSSHPLSAGDNRTVSLMLHSISELERISDHAKSIRICAARLTEKGLSLSSGALAELDVLSAAVRQVTRLTADCFIDRDPVGARRIEPLEQVIDHLCGEMKVRHISRLQRGLCTVEPGMVFTDLLGDCARISDHCSNVAAAVIELNAGAFDTHQYLGRMKRDSEEFRQMYDSFLAQYVLPEP